ncbi:hypothetical protein NQ317_004318 [Molorchus minor]|uniref:Down syndrome cell adhesion molecule-like protein Dscam2 n=1 Tax=Molorchus minor TaxID=1323400 RepID=A0ABQ9JXT4_9CUCU|nr:hypothetical protein NQ317_004318 [Molorchus minor]
MSECSPWDYSNLVIFKVFAVINSFCGPILHLTIVVSITFHVGVAYGITQRAMLTGVLVSLFVLGALAQDDVTSGPVFLREPPNRVDFSNTTGAVVECSARGNPPPDIIWVRSDGTAVGDVPGLRQVLANGNLVFPPFRAEDYRQEVHAQVYACLAKNGEGSIHSRDVNVRAVVSQFYDVDVNKEYAIRGNAAILKCQIPSFVADFVSVVSWHTDQNENFYAGAPDVVQQFYQSEVNNEYVIRGNAAVLKCSIPSFVADFVNVVSWSDSEGHQYGMKEDNYVVNQYYEAEVVSEYVIRGNTAVLKCNIPSFVADFVHVEAWLGSDESTYTYDTNYVVNQFYKAEILTEYVIRGNTAVLKCSIPSFVADFVHVESWIDDQDNVMKVSDDYVVSQYYVTEAENEYVIRGNSALMKCKIPSFVTDFVQVDSWISDEGEVHKYNDDSDYGIYRLIERGVVVQTYEIEADNEYVIRGNSAVMKCEVPSFVSDFVIVENWQDSQGNTYLPEADDYVVQQFYQGRVIDEFVLKGNTGILKCLVPSFVNDFVQIEAWIADDGTTYKYDSEASKLVVNQYYEAQVYDVFVIKGNTAVFKCQIPSFVSDHVEIISWQDTDNNKFLQPTDDYVVSQSYSANVMDESVLKGNTAIFKCHIPSFVSDYVYVTSWLQDHGQEILAEDDSYDSKYLVLPSGELHIKDVGPEDGYKSYQCRTKHRLTGETRLSATKGRLVITEPIGSVIPKFPTIDSSRSFKGIVESSITLLCPAQAFPVPRFRHFLRQFTGLEPVGSIAPRLSAGTSKIQTLEDRHGNSLALLCPAQSACRLCQTKFATSDIIQREARNQNVPEPVSSTLPKVSSKSKYDVIDYRLLSPVALLCPVQGFPVPNFRHFGSSVTKVKTMLYFVKARDFPLLCSEVLVKDLPCSVKPKGCQFPDSEPVGSKAPAFANEIKVLGSEREQGHTLSSCVQRKDILLLYLEPIGYKAPAFSNDATSISYTRSEGQGFGLLCQAQAYPSPRFKLPPKSKLDAVNGESGQDLVLPCDAQASPLPKFRTGWIESASFFIRIQNILHREIYWEAICIAVPCPGLPCSHFQVIRILFVKLTGVGFFPVEPIGSRAPTFSSDSKSSTFIREVGRHFALLCQAQGLPVPFFRVSFLRRKAGKALSYFALLKRILRQYLEPTGKITPKVPGQKYEGGKICIYPENSTVVLTCEVVGYPVPIFSLPGPSVQVQPTNNVPPKKIGAEFGGWRVVNVNEGDVAWLTCQVTGFPVPRFLTILIIEPTNNVAPKKDGEKFEGWKVVLATQNTTAWLTCPVTGYPVPRYLWYKFIEGTNRKQAVALNDRVKQVAGTLIIREAKVEDSGKYLCVVNNSVGGESVETVLTVTAPLKVKVEPPVQTIDFGRPAVFTCKFEGNPIKTISWMKDGNPIDHTDAVLRIEAVRKEDKGMYQCFIRNDQESAEGTAELKLGGRFEPPQIRHAFNEETVQPGNSIFLKCIASGNPTPEIAWELYGRRLSNNDVYQIGQYVTVNGDVVSHLNISAIHTNDGGLYRCVASSKVGSADHSARINVYGLPVVRSMEKQAIVAGGMLIVHCPFAGHPVESVVWERDGRVLPINRKQKVFPNGTLIIENVERTSDQATYVCVAKNSQGYSARGSLEVQVMVAPQILHFDFGDESVDQDETVSVQCTISKGDNPLNITWKLNDKPIALYYGVTVNTMKRVSLLTIESVQADHAGTYSCTASNAAGSVSYSASLNVNVAPQIHPFSFGEESINSGDMTIVNCAVIRGDLPVKIFWTLNRQPVETIDGISVMKTKERVSQLSIDNVQAHHSGEYMCIARNEAGNITYSSYLRVNVPPQIHPFDFGEIAVNSGELVFATCAVIKGDFPMKISWTLNGRVIDSFDGIVMAKTNKRVSQLTVESAQAYHTGEYTCIVENSAGIAKHSAYLNVNGVPSITLLIPLVPPLIHHFDFGDESINSGDIVTATCTVTKGDFPIKISWALNGRPINNFDGVVTAKTNKRVSQLTVESAEAYHNGEYTCIAENFAGIAKQSAYLYVNVSPQITPFNFEDSVDQGESTYLTCSVHKGDLPINISWLHNNISIGYINGILISKNGKKASTVTIDSVQEDHSGTYTCIAENKAGSARHSAILNVNVPPQITPFNFGEDAIDQGESTSLTCSIHKGDLPINISWLHDNISIVAPQITPFDFGEGPVNSGESTSLICTAHKGDLPINISWLHNNISLGYIGGVLITAAGKKTSTLTIDSVQEEHAGVYVCIAENKAGVARHSATLYRFVNGKNHNHKVNVKNPLLVLDTGPQTVFPGLFTVAPIIVPFGFGEEPINTYDFVSVQCSVHKGDLPINIAWLHNNISIGYIDGVITSKIGNKVSAITIDSVQENHAGIYTCIADNNAGRTEYSAILNVNGIFMILLSMSVFFLVPPQILPFNFGDESVNSGDMASLTCSVFKGDLPVNITWLHNHLTVDYNSGISIFKNGNKMSSLSIETVGEEHAGIYTCVTQNRAGNTTHSAELHVNVPPQIVPFDFGEESVNFGEVASVQCTVFKGDFPVNMTWLHDNKTIGPSSGISIFRNGKKISSLSIETVDESHMPPQIVPFDFGEESVNSGDVASLQFPPVILPFGFGEEPINSGEYASVQCSVHKGDSPLNITWYHNNQSIGYFNDVMITTVVSPQILPFAFGEPSVNSGDLASLTCSVHKGDLPLNITWTHDNKSIGYNEGILISKAGSKISTLSIDSVQGEHNGLYTCIVENEAGKSSYSAELHVNVPPQILPFDFGEESVNSGESASVMCNIHKGDIPITIKWFHNNRSLNYRADVRLTKVSNKISALSIDSVQEEHSGDYSCLAENNAGKSVYSAELRIKVSPQIIPFGFGEDLINSGDIVSLTCSVNKGDLPLKIFWEFNGTIIENLYGVTINKVNKRLSTLSIDSVQIENIGEYKCIARNQAGQDEYATNLYVNVLPHIIPFEFEGEVDTGESVQLNCYVSKGDLPLKLRWLLNGKEIKNVYGITTIPIGERTNLLTISSVQPEHSGLFSCRTSNSAGEAIHSAQLLINGIILYVVCPLCVYLLYRGDSVQVACYINKGDMPVKFSWMLNDELVNRYADINVGLFGKKSSVLSIDSVDENLVGNYTCIASNTAGISRYSAELIVKVLPKIHPFTFGDEPSFMGETVSVQCTISTGDQPVKFSWMCNGQPISREINIASFGKKVSVLNIDSISEEHAGNYTCIAANKAGLTTYTAELTVKVVPRIQPFLFGDEPSFMGDSITVQCNLISGDMPVKFSWFLNGKPVREDDGIKLTPFGKKTSVLSIDSVNEIHAGNYTCLTENKAGLGSSFAELVNNTILLEDNPVHAGQFVEVSCTVSEGDLPVEFEWQLNEKVLEDFPETSVSSVGKRTSFLSIESVSYAHAGNYTCIAKNRAGMTTFAAELQVNVPPQILPFEFGDGPVHAGQFIQVSCTVSEGDLPVHIEWMLNGQPLGDFPPLSATVVGKRISILAVDSVSYSHAGNYTCIAKNKAGVMYFSAELQVNVKPQLAPFEFTNSPVHSGQFVQVMCTVFEGDVPLEITWLLNDKPFEDFPQVSISMVGKRSSFLSIDSVSYSHAGNYTCKATNKAGDATYSSQLLVNVLPVITPFDFGDEPVQSDQSVQVQCFVSEGDLPLTLEWLLNSKALGDFPQISTINVGKRSSILSIDSVSYTHAGNYTCKAKNEAGGVHIFIRTASQWLLVPPQITPFDFGEDSVNSGDMITVLCTVSKGDFPIGIKWTLNGKVIDDIPGITIVRSSKRVTQLTIESVQDFHSGDYVCAAKNKAGVAKHLTTLHVNGTLFKDNPLHSGEYAQVNCLVAVGDIPLTIEWKLNGKPVSYYAEISVSKGKRSNMLTLESVSHSTAGNYSCIANNSAGEAAYHTELLVNVLPHLVPFSFGQSVVHSGQTTQATCLVSEGDTPLELSWTFEGNRVDSQSGVVITKIGQKANLLLIDAVTGSQAGNYTCTATNKAGSVSYTAPLNIYGSFFVDLPPRWILEPTDKAFAQGSDATVECKADGFPKPVVTWKRATGVSPGDYKDFKPNNPDIKVEGGTLTINNIQKTNEGYYLCEAVNGIGSGLSAVILISVQAPPQFEVKYRNQTSRRGDPAVLQCEAKGEKPIGILWNINNKRLEPKGDNRYTIREEILPNGVLSDLSIKVTERSDSAIFTCVATNAFGSDDTNINMIVQEVPEVPYGLKVLDKSGKTVQLSWVAPYDGNSPIKKYVIVYKPSKGSWDKNSERVLIPGDQTEAGIFTLRPATTYHIRIIAENEIGISDPSETVTIITAEEVPSGPPANIRVEAEDQHSLVVYWKPPLREQWNGDIQGYYVGYKLANTDKPYLFETVEFQREEEGKEHHLKISNLKTYTQYSVVVQAFNKIGAGPTSEEVKANTAEGVPEQPPEKATCTTLTAQTIRVSWVSPPLTSANGVIKGYKVIYGPSDTWFDENTKDTKITASSETILHGLKKYTNYSMEVLAYTSGGDGVRTTPIHCQTEQDVPEAPTAVKALVMSSDSILVSWKPPTEPNGIIEYYMVYYKETGKSDAKPKSQKIVPNLRNQNLSYQAKNLDGSLKYEFWVTAATTIGEGQPSKKVTVSPSTSVPAKTASFDDTFVTTYKEDVTLPCLAVGVPPPVITWTIKDVKFSANSNDRIRQQPDGSLFIRDVTRTDAGEYSCRVENDYGQDSVIHQLIVNAPPRAPIVQLTSTTTNSLTIKLKPQEQDGEPIHGYTIHYKPEFGDWETIQVGPNVEKYTIEKLLCGTRYQLYVTAYNSIGTGDPSDNLNPKTRGEKPTGPSADKFIEVSSNSIILHLGAWSDGGCPMLYFVIEQKKKSSNEWIQVSNNVKPGQNFVLLDLDPAQWYHLRITSHNNAGFNVVEYEFATLTATGGTIAPAREIPKEDTIQMILANLNLVVPVVAAVLVIIVAIIVICTIAPARDMPAMKMLFPWIPDWVDWNIAIPVAATVVVVVVGIVVICVALSRKAHGPLQTRLRSDYDVVYNQSCNATSTLDKRRPDLRDELGYIAPPNRKLPPVPGSNYNTCDRIKRGTLRAHYRSHSTWDPRRHLYEELRSRRGSNETVHTHRGMDDEICPYATFHLLGFREEMDPTKAMQFQTFPHPHAGTMGASGMNTPHGLHSRNGSQSMPRQNRNRYDRVGSQGNGSIYSPGPEYDDPANCAPEDEQYGSQYGGYGAPYDQYGSRGSIGRRSLGSMRVQPTSNSPEPPPPPPRNHDASFNDSKDSNEISEAECDRDQLINSRAYGEDEQVMRGNSKDGMSHEEMRKLIERNETGQARRSKRGTHSLRYYGSVICKATEEILTKSMF